jgi:2-haloalkanoic acid dehalogenase type II
MNSPRYDAVVFDLLTALIDSWTLWNEAAGSAEQGLKWRRKYLELTYAAGAYRPYETIVLEAAEQSGMRLDAVERLLTSWDELPLWPETTRVLVELGRRVPLAVATNCSTPLGARAAACTGWPFSVVVTAEQAGFYKPRPEPYLAVLSALGTAPRRTLFVAGSAADVPGAKGVGMPVFWHNRMGLGAIDAAVPDFQASSLEPLLSIV